MLQRYYKQNPFLVVEQSTLRLGMAILFPANFPVVLLVELDEVVDVIARAEEDGAPLVYAGGHNIEDAATSSSGDTTGLQNTISCHRMHSKCPQTCSVRYAIGNAS